LSAPLARFKIQLQFGHTPEADMRLTKNIGMILLAVWLIVGGLMVLIPAFTFSGAGTVMAILAIVAGVFILIGR
jgi:hypothetical protein